MRRTNSNGGSLPWSRPATTATPTDGPSKPSRVPSFSSVRNGEVTYPFRIITQQPALITAWSLVTDDALHYILLETYALVPYIWGIEEFENRPVSGMAMEYFMESEWGGVEPEITCTCGRCDVCHRHAAWVDAACQIVSIVVEGFNMYGWELLRYHEGEIIVHTHLPDIVIYTLDR